MSGTQRARQSRTIKQHRGRVMQKLGARSVAELVRLAERLEGAR